VRVERDPPVLRRDIAGRKLEAVDVGDAPGAVDYSVRLDRAPGPALFIDHAEPIPCPLNPLDCDRSVNRDPDPLSLPAYLRDRIRVHIVEQPRQRLEDRDFGARAGVGVAKLESDHSAADKHHLSRQSALAQHIVGGDHHFGAGKWEPVRLRAGGDYNVLCLQGLAVDRDRVRAGKAAALADHFDAVIRELDTKPAVIGHSFGGLMTQILAGRGLSAASVAIDPAPFRGVLPLPISALRSASPVLSNPLNHGRAVPLTFEQFRYAFTNAVEEAEAKDLYATYAVPAPGEPLFQAAAANLNPWTEARVDTKNADRGPLPLILMVPLFGFFYLGDVAKFRYGIISTLTLNVALFAVICRVLGHPAFALPAADGDVLNLVSVLGAGAYVMMMALSYSRLLEHQDALQEKSAAQRLMAEQLLFAKEAAEAASRAKSEFLAVTSHELRTPLNAIIGFSQLALRKPFGPLGERYADYLKDIEESGTHLLELINDILDVAKAESGRFDLYEEACDVRRVIASSLRLLHRRAMRAKLAVTLKVPDTLPLLMADARRLKQMLLNLLGNAIKFTPPGGTILIEAGIEKDGVLAISISDSGIGIGEKHLENVLEPFFQVDSSHARSAEGVGLGLPLVASIIARHGGTLGLTSELGEGTTATLRFPSRRVVIPANRVAAVV